MKELPKTDAEAHEYIQFRGSQTSVTHDDTGVRFVSEHRDDHVGHKPLPVVPDDADPAETPDDAVARSVAEYLVERNPLVCWGVVCEHPTDDGDVCGRVFDSPKGRNSHQSAHADGSGGGDDD